MLLFNSFVLSDWSILHVNIDRRDPIGCQAEPCPIRFQKQRHAPASHYGEKLLSFHFFKEKTTIFFEKWRRMLLWPQLTVHRLQRQMAVKNQRQARMCLCAVIFLIQAARIGNGRWVWGLLSTWILLGTQFFLREQCEIPKHRRMKWKFTSNLTQVFAMSSCTR